MQSTHTGFPHRTQEKLTEGNWKQEQFSQPLFFDCLHICERVKEDMKESDVGAGTGDRAQCSMKKVSLGKQLLTKRGLEK